MSLIEKVAKWGGLGAFVAAPDRVWRAFTAGAVRRVRLEGNSGDLPGYVARYLSEVATVLWRPTGTYFTERVFDRRIQSNRDMAFERLQSVSTLYLYRHVPVLLSAHKAEQRHDGGRDMFSEMAFPRGALDLDKLVNEAVDHYRASQESSGVNQRFRVINRSGRGFRQDNGNRTIGEDAPGGKKAGSPYGFNRVIDGKHEDLGAPTAGQAARWVWWSPEASVLRADAKRWRSRQVWCAERGIPWRRGWMLHGPPGNGKTQALITVAEELDLPVYVLNIATMGSEEYETSYAAACADAPAMIVIEDLHATFRRSDTGMVNVVSEFGVSFNTMLNCLSGVSRYQGLIVAFTTNHIEEVDPALCQPEGKLPHEVSRPDRVDLCVEFKLPPEEGRYAVALRVLRDEAMARAVARETEGKSIAQVQDICYRRAETL